MTTYSQNENELVRRLADLLTRNVEDLALYADTDPRATPAERSSALGRALCWGIVRASRGLPVATVVARLRAVADRLESEEAQRVALAKKHGVAA
jgi:hypothetical protein